METKEDIVIIDGEEWMPFTGDLARVSTDDFRIVVRKKVEVRYLTYKDFLIPIYRSIEGVWKDSWGTVYALRDKTASIDPVDRCGVGFFSLPEDHPLTKICARHDYFYESPVFQAFHTRAEADEALWIYSKILGFPTAGRVMRFIARVFGGIFWDNRSTR